MTAEGAGTAANAALVGFTRAGCELAVRLAAALGCPRDRVSAPARFADELGLAAFDTLEAWTADAFVRADALVFVGAAGIAVRAVAPHVRDKMEDPAVVCVDERGHVAVPLLSGHVGGANDLARAVAQATGGVAAVSTATDLNGAFAVDSFAAEHGLGLVERDLAKSISAALLEGRPVSFGDGLGAVVSSDVGAAPFPRTLHLVPRDVVVGAGCRRGTPPQAFARAVDDALAAAGTVPEAVAVLATIDLKADEPALVDVARSRGWELRTFSADELARVEGDFESSDFVERTVGVGNVCERAAVAAGGQLVQGKRVADGVTVAVARLQGAMQAGALFVVGLGPGAGAGMTLRARAALEACQVVVGYSAYVDLLRDDFPDKDYEASGMMRELDRCRRALELAAAGRTVALVCSGDAGVYGMASPVLELAGDFPGVRVEVVPGVTAATAGAAVLGAPLAHDFAVVSLSDLLTPWDEIERRLEAAAAADFCLCLYNPSSRRRADHLQRACDVLLRHKSAGTACATVRNIGREGERACTCTLGELRDAHVDMFTTVYVGSTRTRMVDGRLVTPRGYDRKYGPGSRAAAGGPTFLVYGGTSEGRSLAEWLSSRGTCDVVYCAATEYGAQLAEGLPRVRSVEGPLDDAAKARLADAHDFACIVDATHPFAMHVSASLRNFAASRGLPLLRVERDDADIEGLHTVGSAAEAAAVAAACDGNVLLTTGTKDLETFVRALPDHAERLHVRVLPVVDSIAAVRDHGVPARNVVAMQGPFSVEMNELVMRERRIALVVTKASGEAGGFPQKVEAARHCGARVVVVGRPDDPAGEGLPLEAVKRELVGRYGA